MGRHVVLVGMMGAGKSTAGEALAAALARPFVDLDDEIEQDAESSIAEIFEQRGEAGFRKLETDCLDGLLAREAPTVIAAGGGVVTAATNRAAMRRFATVIWLRATPETLAGRLGADPGEVAGRPLLAEKGETRGVESVDTAGLVTRLAAIAADREDAYASAAHHVVDVDGLSAEALTGRLAELIGPTP